MEKYIKVDVMGISLLTIVTAIKVITGIDIRIQTRIREIVYLKKIYYLLAHNRTPTTLKAQANFVNTKNHATALYHKNTARDMLEKYPQYQQVYEQVVELLDRHDKDGTSIDVDENKVIHYVNTLETKITETVYVDRVIDVYETGIPLKMINLLRTLTEEELEDLYENRLVPYSRMKNKEGRQIRFAAPAC
jgi:hypothetical protein